MLHKSVPSAPCIAGVQTGLLPDEPLPGLGGDTGPAGAIMKLRRRLAHAEKAFAAQQFTAVERGFADPRIAPLSIHSEHIRGPMYDFLLDKELLFALEKASHTGELTLETALRTALAHTEGAVLPDFTASAPNAVSASYYASDIAFTRQTGLATMFAKNRPLNYALGALLTAHSGTAGRPLRVKELCSGNRTAHWKDKACGALDAGAAEVTVTLTDFTVPHIERGLQGRRLHTTALRYSLFDPLSPLPENERFDAIITTYGFDSVWQPEDATFIKQGGRWYAQLYRLKVAPWNPRRDDLVKALREGKPLADARVQDYDGIFVETALVPADLASHPYGKYIETAGNPCVVFPGGFIKRVREAFNGQLKGAGVFVNADTGNFGSGASWSRPNVSGVAALFKSEDYVIAKRILEAEYGLHAELLTMADLAEHYLAAGWERHASKKERGELLNNPTNGLIIVSKQ